MDNWVIEQTAWPREKVDDDDDDDDDVKQEKEQ